MADSPKDKIKYGLLRVVDISGFKVLDPPVRLAFGEEPQKQIRDIAKFMLLPILFLLACVGIWSVVGPNHKTKSGEVPGPSKVLTAWDDAQRFDERENEKEQAFELMGAAREREILKVKKELAELEAQAATLKAKAAEVAESSKSEIEADIAPLQARYDARRDDVKTNKTARKEELATLAEEVASGDAPPEKLLALVEKDRIESDQELEELRDLGDQIDEIREDPPEAIANSQLASNRVADEVQHYKKRLDYLTSGNRRMKYEEAVAKVQEEKEELATAATGAEALSSAKSVIINKERAEQTLDQSYPRAATIMWQTKRSIATVLVGFFLAAAVAIPVGIMCGLNRVVMACFTPIISIFRPVSPVVWLLIFQIIVGAFFPDPETHPLFVFMNSAINPLSFLQVNPAMIFSACTVAMCALWPALVNTALGVSAIDQDHLNVARVLKLGFWSRLFKIVIPSSLPLVFAGLRISLGVGWMVLIAAEALSSSDGLGKFVWDEYQNGSSQSFANIILACFVVGIIGFFLDRCMIVLQRLVSFDDGSATA
jgi:nitrate/nitrite transport system permease protein